MGGMGEPCFLTDWTQQLGKGDFNRILLAISLRQAEEACSFLSDAFMKKKGEGNIRISF